MGGFGEAKGRVDALLAGDEDGSILGGLEAAIDDSIDSKVNGYLSLPQMSSMPIPCDQSRACGGVNWWEGADIHRGELTYLDKLQKQQQEKEERKEKILRNLRIERNIAAETAAKGMLSMEKSQLQSAVQGAEQRVSEEAQKWDRLSSASLHEASVAQDYAVHMANAAFEHNKEMNGMLRSLK